MLKGRSRSSCQCRLSVALHTQVPEDIAKYDEPCLPRPYPRHGHKDEVSYKGLFKCRQFFIFSDLSNHLLVHSFTEESSNMAPKFMSFPVFAIFLFACLSLLARASPIPIVLPPSEGITLFKDAVAREALLEVNVLRREAAPLLELREDTGFITEPSILVGDPGDDLEARICRYGCL